MVENLRVITSRRRGAIMATVETTTTCNVTFPCPRKPSDSWSRRGRPNTFRFKANTFTSDSRFYQHQPQLNDFPNIFFFAQWVGHGLSSLSGVTQKGGFLEGKKMATRDAGVSSHDRGAPYSQSHGINFAFTGMKTKKQERSSNIKSTIRLAGATSVLYTALHTAITRWFPMTSS